MLMFRPLAPNERFARSGSNTTEPRFIPHIHNCSGDACRWTWDEPLRLFSVTDEEETVVTLPLEGLHTFVPALARLSSKRVAVLARGLEDAARMLSDPGRDSAWCLELREALALLVMFILASTRKERNAAKLEPAALAVTAQLTVDSPSGCWLGAYWEQLPYAHRAGILASAVDVEAAMPIRDLVWWTAGCRLDLAIEWTRAFPSDETEAVRELIDAASAYVHLLRSEPNRRALESFYAARGTTSEREVLRAHAAREECTGIDDLVRADMMGWLLRRYSLNSARRMLEGTLRPIEWAGLIIAGVLTSGALGLFLSRELPRTQVFLQIVAFVVVVWCAPRIFALLLPRAMFGTLLAWITVVLAQTASLLPILDDDKDVHDACHLWLIHVIEPMSSLHVWASRMKRLDTVFVQPPELADFLAIVVACLSVSAIFLMVEVSNRLATRIFERSVHCVLVMLLGSLFWGAMFVPVLQYIVVRNHVYGTACRCIYPAWILGSVSAVVFGILVQLMWDDRAVSDSIGAQGESFREA